MDLAHLDVLGLIVWASADVRGWSFCPPGGLMSKNLSKAVEPFVTSVAVGKDVVPRLSVVNIGRLIDQMVILVCHARSPHSHCLQGMYFCGIMGEPLLKQKL